VIVKVGDVRSELGNIVNDEKIDLVVMGASRRHRVGRLLLNSLSKRIQNTTPVLTVPHVNASEELHPLSRIPVHHVLYATALSESGEAGLDFCVELARRTRAHLTVFHVMRPLMGELGMELPGF